MRGGLDLSRRRRCVGTFFETGLRRAFGMRVCVRLTCPMSRAPQRHDGTRKQSDRVGAPGPPSFDVIMTNFGALGWLASRSSRGDRTRAKAGAPGRTRTCDHRLRRPVLYPTELRARTGSKYQCNKSFDGSVGSSWPEGRCSFHPSNAPTLCANSRLLHLRQSGGPAESRRTSHACAAISDSRQSDNAAIDPDAAILFGQTSPCPDPLPGERRRRTHDS